MSSPLFSVLPVRRFLPDPGVPVSSEPFYDSVMDDYDDDDDDDNNAGASAARKRLGLTFGLKLRPWESTRSDQSEVSLIDFTDDSFSSATPSPLTETRQPDEDTLKVQPGDVVSSCTCGSRQRSSVRFWRRSLWSHWNSDSSFTSLASAAVRPMAWKCQI